MTIIKLDKPDKIRNYASNMLAVIGEAMLKEHGNYRCTIDGKKVAFELEEAK